MSKTAVFCLDARAELTADEAANVKKYKLGNEVIYSSDKSRKHMEAAGAALGAGSGLGIVAGLASGVMSRLALNITLDSLVKEQHIECKSLDELLGAEEALNQACQVTKLYLDTAATFDGSEQVIEF